jgi:adenylosuccinate synthase
MKAELASFEEYRETMRKYVVDGVSFMTSAQQSNTKIVVEGANVMFSSQTLKKHSAYYFNRH